VEAEDKGWRSDFGQSEHKRLSAVREFDAGQAIAVERAGKKSWSVLSFARSGLWRALNSLDSFPETA
jgi:hypothetical protein